MQAVARQNDRAKLAAQKWGVSHLNVHVFSIMTGIKVFFINNPFIWRKNHWICHPTSIIFIRAVESSIMFRQKQSFAAISIFRIVFYFWLLSSFNSKLAIALSCYENEVNNDGVCTHKVTRIKSRSTLFCRKLRPQRFRSTAHGHFVFSVFRWAATVA